MIGCAFGYGAGGLTDRGRSAQHVLLLPVVSTLTHPFFFQKVLDLEIQVARRGKEERANW